MGEGAKFGKRFKSLRINFQDCSTMFYRRQKKLQRRYYQIKKIVNIYIFALCESIKINLTVLAQRRAREPSLYFRFPSKTPDETWGYNVHVRKPC